MLGGHEFTLVTLGLQHVVCRASSVPESLEVNYMYMESALSVRSRP